MRMVVGSDEDAERARAVVADLEKRGHRGRTIGAVAGEALEWPEVGRSVGRAVVDGSADGGVCMCWTGTGVSIAANRIPGVRAALCADAETARGARRWNDANVLVLSNRATSAAVAVEILDAWFEAGPDESESDNIASLDAGPPGII
ncbi:MAG: RpiB/LacA/LacB family sugar-phosphate isomerase [Actinobacteria bacterium ATB1]|nr:RpiB/LacA/LacB family sugar-phosphate isomerase [Actinobacteria bacterium ATB1]